MRVAALMSLAVTAVALPRRREDLGPGAGPWEVVSPESQGLSTDALRLAEERTNSALGARVCFIVVKNGKIVFETYRDAGSEARTQSAFSATKSMCASLFGIAKAQGWASVHDSVLARNGGTRLCNSEATFQNVLTMTGTSPDISNPRYSYDTLGVNCLDTLTDFIQENNPDGLSAFEWKQRHYHEVLGLEHTVWNEALGSLGCGFQAEASCRDLARMGQLWTNGGEWAGAGQVQDREYTAEGTSFVFPTTSREYGYTLPLRVSDPVDPTVGAFVGLNAQCARFSPEHKAVIVSMGSGGSCGAEWDNTRDAIVSDDHPLYNASRARLDARAAREEDSAAQAQASAASGHREKAAVRAAVADLQRLLTANEANNTLTGQQEQAVRTMLGML